MQPIKTEKGCQKIDALLAQALKLGDSAENGGSTVNSTVTVVAAVLDGALQVLAGEVARAVNAAVRTIDDGGDSNRLSAVHNGSSIAADVMTVIAAVLDGALQVLAGEVGRAVRAGKDLGAVKDRHFCFWNAPTTTKLEKRQSLRKAK